MRTFRVRRIYGLAAVAIIALALAASQLPYRSAEADALSRQFIDLLAHQNYADAYLLTTHGSLVGRTPEEFRRIADHEFGATGELQAKLISYSPAQTYWNRLHRWVRGRPLDPASASVDYQIDQNGKIVRLFKIRLSHSPAGWKIDYFESHAG